MSRKRGPGHGSGNLSEDERALWEAAASDAEPLKRRSRVHAALEAAPVASKSDSAAGKATARRVVAPAGSQPAKVPVKPPAMSPFDARKERKIRSGAARIERRVDLHGMRQREAHSELRRFLISAHAAGCRVVLVITGKGAPRRRRHEDGIDPSGAPEPGVLRREVPRWLADPELRAIVVSYTTAAVQHGGEGALYVHLRRERGLDK